MSACPYCGNAARSRVGRYRHCGAVPCRGKARRAHWRSAEPIGVDPASLLDLHWQILAIATHSETTDTPYTQRAIADQLGIDRRKVDELRADLRAWGLLARGHRSVDGPRCTRAGLLYCIEHTHHLGRVAA